MSAGLPDDWTPLESVTVTKALDANGTVRLAMHATDGLNTWEALGMCIYASDGFRRDMEDEEQP